MLDTEDGRVRSGLTLALRLVMLTYYMLLLQLSRHAVPDFTFC